MLTRDNTSGPGEHPELEELAALIDNRLSGERAARVRSHLATCAECREVFFETVDFVLDEEAQGRGGAPHPFEHDAALRPPAARKPPTSRWRRTASLAAAAVIAVGVGLAVYQRSFAPPQTEWARIASGLGAHEAKLHGHYPGRDRGPSPESSTIDRLFFRLGGALVNLLVSWVGGNWDEADAAIATINGVNQGFEKEGYKLPDDITRYVSGLRAKLAKQPRAQPAEIETLAKRYRAPEDPADAFYFDLGTWTEAGHLAVAARQTDFLTSRDHRRFPAYFLRVAKRESYSLNPKVESARAGIKNILAKDRLNDKDYEDLEKLYSDILSDYARPPADLVSPPPSG